MVNCKIRTCTECAYNSGIFYGAGLFCGIVFRMELGDVEVTKGTYVIHLERGLLDKYSC